jgi:arylsulfatase A-like enzyme
MILVLSFPCFCNYVNTYCFILGMADLSYNYRLFHPNDPNPPPLPTPNIDKLAEISVRMKRYYTHPICGPSRASLLTGRTSHSLGNPFPMPLGGSLPKEYRTVAQEFADRGYINHFVGKWGVDTPPLNLSIEKKPSVAFWNGIGPVDGHTPTQRGFHTFYGLYSSGHNHFTKEVTRKNAIDWHRHNQTHKLDYPDVDDGRETYSTHLFVEESLALINEWTPNGDGHFLHLSFTAPHDPLLVPPEYIAKDTPCAAIRNWRRRAYCGMVRAIDEGVGQIVAKLEERQLLTNTIIFFTTDNGGAPAVGGFNYPFRGQKATVYEGGVRGPAFLYLPPNYPSYEYDGMFHVSDLAPTLLALVDRQSGRLPFHQLGNIDGVDQSETLLQSGKIFISKRK